MKLVLEQSVPSLGEVGQVVQVKPGYGRNYLIPQGLAYVASSDNIQKLEEEQAKALELSRRDYLEARRRASQLEGMSLSFSERAGDDGKLFGSVSQSDVTERANEGGLDFQLDKKAVQLDEPIKEIGSFEVAVRLHVDVEISIKVEVEREDG